MQNTQWDASVIGVMLRGGITASIESNPKQCDDYKVDRAKLVEKLNSLTLFEHLGLLDWCRHGDPAPL